jgi:hypothetical protein
VATSASGTATVSSTISPEATRPGTRSKAALAGWSDDDRAALARLTQRFSGRIVALIEENDAS